MAINVIVQHKGGFLPYILLLTQAPIFVWFDGTIIVYYYYPLNYSSMYYNITVFKEKSERA